MHCFKSQVVAKSGLLTFLVFLVLPLGRASAHHRRATTYDDTNPAIVYSQGNNGGGVNGWGTGSDSGDFGGGEHYSNAYSGSFVVHFSGTDFQWIGKKGPNFGIASLFMDGQAIGTVDAYSPTVLHQQVLYGTSGLSNGAHSFQVKIGTYPSPAKNPSSSNWYQVMDGFTTSGTPLNVPMISPQNASVTKAGTWSFGPNILSGAYCWSNDRSTPGSLSLPFSGSGVEVYGHPEGEDGKMDVYIDGAYVTTVDEFNPLLDSVLSDSNDDSLLYVKTGLPAGNHTLKVVVSQTKNPSATDYYTQIDGFIVLPAGGGGGGGGVVGNGTGLTGQYYDNVDFTNLKVTRTDGTVNFDWGSGSPDPSIGPDTFSVRWTGQIQAQFSDVYTFYTDSDDGVRLWVNGQLVISNWTDHAPTENSGTISLAAGQKVDLQMEFYENGGGAMAKLLWSSPSTSKQAVPQSQLYPANVSGGAGTGLTGQYFDNIDFTNLKVTRTDATVNFDWGSGSPDPSIGSDTFSVRWTGQVQAQFSETYTFYTDSDDGVRLWVNGQLVINNWTDHAPTENSGTISLASGQKADLKLEYYENGGGAQAKLLWSSASTSKQIVPQSQLYPSGGGGGGSGALSGTSAAAAPGYNLTSLGTTDWVHWGRAGVFGNLDRKATGGGQISNVTFVGTGEIHGGYSDASRSVTWTDGTPTASFSNDHGYIWSNGALQTGFQFTVPADAASRTLFVYYGASTATVTVIAHLSDGSAADYTHSMTGPGAALETITYHAASAGQFLTIKVLKTGNNSGFTDGSADLDAAILQ